MLTAVQSLQITFSSMQLTPTGALVGTLGGHSSQTLHRSSVFAHRRVRCEALHSRTAATLLPSACSTAAAQQQPLGAQAVTATVQTCSRSSILGSSRRHRRRPVCLATDAPGNSSSSGDGQEPSQPQEHIQQPQQQQQKPSARLLSLLRRALGPAVLLAVAAAVSPRHSYAAGAAASSR